MSAFLPAEPLEKSTPGGVIVPAITPVDLDDRIDEGAYRQQLRRLIKAGVQGIFAGGSAGEGPLLVLREWEHMASIAFEECQGKVCLLGGVMDTSTRRILERTRILRQIGYSNFVVTPTFYVGSKLHEEQLRLFGECKDHSEGMEMVAYNIPSCTGAAIQVETFCEMAQRGWITFCKDSSEDMSYFKRLTSEGADAGLRVLLGSERHALDGLLNGAEGIVPVCANYDPATFLRAYEARSRPDELRAIQERINTLVENIPLGARSWVAAVKYAVALSGIGSGDPVSPLEPLSDPEKQRLRDFVTLDSAVREDRRFDSDI